MHESKCTCAFEVSTEFEAFADTAFRVRGKSFLDVLHTYTARTIFTLPEQTIDEHLQREKLFNNTPRKTQKVLQTGSGFQTIGVPQGWMLGPITIHNCVTLICMYN